MCCVLQKRPPGWPLTSGEQVILHLGEQTCVPPYLCARPPGSGPDAPPGVGVIWRRLSGQLWLPLTAAALRTPAALRAAMAAPLAGALDLLGSIPHIDSDDEDPLIASANFKPPAPLAKRQDSQGSPGKQLDPQTYSYSVFARSLLSLPQTPFSRSLRSTICNPGHPYSIRTLRITNGGPERAKKRSGGTRSCKHRIRRDSKINLVVISREG